jgi:hypothetical protein
MDEGEKMVQATSTFTGSPCSNRMGSSSPSEGESESSAEVLGCGTGVLWRRMGKERGG